MKDASDEDTEQMGSSEKDLLPEAIKPEKSP